MSRTIKTVGEAVAKLQPDSDYWVDAFISLIPGENAILEAQYENKSELAGTWVMRYRISGNTVSHLLRANLLYLDDNSSLESELKYRLKKNLTPR